MYSPISFIKSLIVRAEGLLGASIAITPGGSTNTTTTIVSTQTADRTITLPNESTTLVGTAQLQAVSDAITAHVTDATDAHDASAISVVATAEQPETDVQSAIDFLSTNTPTIPNNEPLNWRNSADDQDVGVIVLDATDDVVVEAPQSLRLKSGVDSMYLSTQDNPSGSAGWINIETGESSAPTAIVLRSKDVVVSTNGGNEPRVTLVSLGGDSISIEPSPSTVPTSLVLPPDAGTSGQILSTDGLGVMSWIDPGNALAPIPNGDYLQWRNPDDLADVDVMTLNASSDLIIKNDTANISMSSNAIAGFVSITSGPPDLASALPGGVIELRTANSETADPAYGSGDINISTGIADNSKSGQILLATASASSGESGIIALTTGQAGTAGSVVLTVGQSDGAAGSDLILNAGDSTLAEGGDIILNPGTGITTNGVVSATGPVNISNVAGQQAKIKLTSSANGSTTVQTSAAMTTNITLTLPPSASSAGQVLTNDGAGALSWENPGGIPTGARMGYVGTTAPTGWVLGNGRTIGSAASGATERANSDVAQLYTLLWNSFTNTVLPVSGGRGASAAADFAANKTIALPDFRGRTAIGNDTMGNTAASRVTNAVSGFDASVNGASGGSQSHTLTITEMPSHTHTQNSHTHQLQGQANLGYAAGASTVTFAQGGAQYTGQPATAVNQNTGGGGAHRNMQPSWVETVIIKL